MITWLRRIAEALLAVGAAALGFFIFKNRPDPVQEQSRIDKATADQRQLDELTEKKKTTEQAVQQQEAQQVLIEKDRAKLDAEMTQVTKKVEGMDHAALAAELERRAALGAPQPKAAPPAEGAVGKPVKP